MYTVATYIRTTHPLCIYMYMNYVSTCYITVSVVANTMATPI